MAKDSRPLLVFFGAAHSGPARRMESLMAHLARKERTRLRVTAVDGRKVFFETSVKDELDQVGAGTHTRFVVDKAKTFERLKAKAARFAALSG